MSDSEQRLVQAVDRYLKSVEDGRPLSRDQLLADYADIESELRDCLASLDFLKGATADEPSELPGETDSEFACIEPSNDVLKDSNLGDYRLKQVIGKGGMGVVYDAEQLSLQRRVAVKVLPFAAALDESRLHRFRHEAMSAAALHHPNIVPVFHVGHENGTHFYVMQLIEGLSLAQLVRQDRNSEPPAEPANSNQQLVDDDTISMSSLLTDTGRKASRFREIAKLFASIADALEHAHNAGIVHRDVKPSNLLLDKAGKLWLTDFGLAMRADTVGLTTTGDIVGTLKYMSPEQVLGNRATVDHRSDVFSLGLSLYELLVRRPAFDADNRAALVQQISNSEPPSLRSVNASIPIDLRTIVEKAIAREADDRYQTAAEFAADLRHFAEDKPVTARRPSLRRKLIRWAKRHHRAVTVAIVAGLLSVGGLIAGNIVLAAEQRKSQEALGDTKAILNEYQAAMSDISQVITDHQLFDQPGYEAMIGDYADVMRKRFRILHQVAHEDPDVRKNLREHIEDVAGALWRSGDKATAQDLYVQVGWLAEKDVASARKAYRRNPSGVTLTKLVESLDALGHAERYTGGSTENLAKRFDSALRLIEQRNELSDSVEVWLAKGRLHFERARMTQKDDEAKLTDYTAAAAAFEQCVKANPTIKARRWLSMASGFITIIENRRKNFDAASVASSKDIQLMADICQESFTPLYAEAYCRSLARHIAAQRGLDNQEAAAAANDRMLQVARRGMKAFNNVDMRRHFVTACANRFFDIDRGTRPMENAIELLRECRQLLYVRQADSHLKWLITPFNGVMAKMLDDESLPAESRRQSYHEFAILLRLQADVEEDTRRETVLRKANEESLQRIRQYDESLRQLLDDEQRARGIEIENANAETQKVLESIGQQLKARGEVPGPDPSAKDKKGPPQKIIPLWYLNEDPEKDSD